MKIIVQLEVEIDPADWTTTFGIVNCNDIRREVKEYVLKLAGGGVFDDGEVPATITLRNP